MKHLYRKIRSIKNLKASIRPLKLYKINLIQIFYRRKMNFHLQYTQKKKKTIFYFCLRSCTCNRLQTLCNTPSSVYLRARVYELGDLLSGAAALLWAAAPALGRGLNPKTRPRYGVTGTPLSIP